MILLMRPHTVFFQNLTHVPCVSRAKCPMWVNCMRRQTPGLRYRAGFISRLCVCVCVLLHGWNVSRPECIYLVLPSCTPGSERRRRRTLDAFHRCWTLTPSRCWRPKPNIFTLSTKKKVPTCVFRLSTSLEEEDPRLTGGPCVSHTHTHICARCGAKNSIDIPRNSLSSRLQFSPLSSLFICSNECWPLWPPVEGYLQGQHFEADHHPWTPANPPPPPPSYPTIPTAHFGLKQLRVVALCYLCLRA